MKMNWEILLKKNLIMKISPLSKEERTMRVKKINHLYYKLKKFNKVKIKQMNRKE